MKLSITPCCTLEEVAERLYKDGDTPRILSRERIRQIETQALRKFKKGMERRGYSLTDLTGSTRHSKTGNTPYFEQ